MIKKIRLGDIATTITKGTTPTTVGFPFVDTGVNFVKIESISENGVFLPDRFAHITDECNKKLGRSRLEENDILFSIAGAIGRTAIVPKSILPANTNQALAIIRIPPNAINLQFVLHALQSQAVKEQSEKQKQGVAQLNLSLKNIADIQIPLVSSAKQAEIVKNLADVDAIIVQRREQLRLIDQLVKSRFVELFGEPDTNEKNWKVYKMEQLCEVGSSKRIYQNEQSMTGIPFLRISDLVNRIDAGSQECELYIPEERFERLKEQGLVPISGDILLTARGTLGKCYIVQEKDKFYFQDGMITWLSKYSTAITPLYISYLFEIPGFRKQIDSLQAGSTVAYLSISMTKKLDVMVPPIALQNQFAAFVEQVDKSKLAVQKSLDELETLKKSLMQQYFG